MHRDGNIGAVRLLTLFALALAGGSPVLAQELRAELARELERTAPALDAELLTAHPGLANGDGVRVREDLLAALEANPESPLALEAVLVMRRHWPEGERRTSAARLLALAEKVTDAEASLQLRWAAHAEARRLRFSDAPVTLEGDLYDEFVRTWWVVGPLGPLDHPAPARMELAELEAVAEQGESAAPEAPFAVGLAADYPAADGSRREWQPVERGRNSNFVTPADRVYPTGGVTYALALFTPARWQEGREGVSMVLELRTSSAVRAWWNDELVVDEPRTDPRSVRDRFLVRVPVVSGTNALLVRTATGDSASIAARLIDDSGRAVDIREPELGGPTEARFVGAINPNASLEIFGPAEVLSDPLLAAGVDDGPFVPALAVTRAELAGREDIALAVPAPDPASFDDPILGARALAAWRYARLRALQGASHLPQEVERRELMDLVAALEQDGPFFHRARWLRMWRLSDEDRPLESLAVTDDWIAAAPERAQPRQSRAEVLGVLDRTLVMRNAALREVAAAFPLHADVRLALAQDLVEEGDAAGARDLAWAALQLDGSGDEALNLFLDETWGIPSESEPRLARLLERARAWQALHPESDDADDLVQRLTRRLGTAGEVEALLEAAVAERPEQPDLWWELGEHRLEHGDVMGARAAYAAELARDPADSITRELMRRLGDEDPAERFFAEFAPDVDAALERAAGIEGSSIVEALDSGLVYFFPDGSSHTRSGTWTVPRDRAGAEALHALPAMGDTRAIRVLAQDGRELEPVEVEGEWVLPALEPGDVIEHVWDSESGGYAGAAPPSTGWRFASFERAFATSRWVVYVPDGLPGRLEVLNFDGTHEEVPWEGGTVHVLTGSYPLQVPEALMPSYLELLPFATYGGDADVRAQLLPWRGTAEGLSVLPADLEDEVLEFVQVSLANAGRVPASEALFEALDEYLVGHDGDGRPGNVWLQRRGWPLGLLAAMYDIAGVSYEWAVIEEPVAPELDPEPVEVFAGDGGFSQLALRLALTDEHGSPIWIIPAGSPGAPFGALTPQMAGAPAWILAANGDVRREEVPRTQLAEQFTLDVELDYSLDAQGSAVVRGRSVIAPPQGSVLARQLAEATEQQRSAFARQQAAGLVPGVDVTAAHFVTDGTEGPGAVLLFEGSDPGFVRQRGDEFAADFPAPPLNLDTSFGPAERRFPLAVRAAMRLRMRISIDPGENWRLVGGPPAIDEAFGESPARFAVELTQSEVEGRTRYELLLEQRGLMLPPDEVPAFIARMGETNANLERPLRFERQ